MLTNKLEIKEVFVIFYTIIETRFQTKICILHSDNGTKYFNEQLTSFLHEKGIFHQTHVMILLIKLHAIIQLFSDLPINYLVAMHMFIIPTLLTLHLPLEQLNAFW